MPARFGVDQGDPPAPDDLNVVKRLCGMGFGRQQAVEALEKHDYHFEAALNLGRSRTKEETAINTRPSGENGHESYKNNYAPLIVWEVS